MAGEDRAATAGGVEFRDLRSLRDAINTVAGHRNALDGYLVDIAIGLLSNDMWKGEGLSKPEQFLAFRCGLSNGSAKRYVEVARRADELPASVAALQRGELSLDQLMPIVRRVPAWADDQVLSLSKRLTVGQINAVINKYNFERSGPPDDSAVESEGETVEPADAEASEHGDEGGSSRPSATGLSDRCWMGVGDDGRWRLSIETSAELGMTIQSSIREARDREFLASGNRISDAEALAEVAQRSLDGVVEPRRRERFRSMIHLHTDGRATDHLGVALPDSIREHLTCDATLVPAFCVNGVPISVGRRQRIVPDRTRRIVLLRDGGCAVPGCGATQHLEVHHITHWSKHGPTDTWNLITLCPHHHRMHHLGKLDIVGNADLGTVVIRNQHGVNMALDGPRPEPPEGPPPAPIGEYSPPLCERLDMNYVSFVHPDRLALIADRSRARFARTPARWAEQARRQVEAAAERSLRERFSS